MPRQMVWTGLEKVRCSLQVCRSGEVAMEESAENAKGSDSRTNFTSSEEKVREEPRKLQRRRTPEELEALEQLFWECDTPSETRRQTIAKELNISMKQVSHWFQNRRQRERKKELVDKTESLTDYAAALKIETEEKTQVITKLQQENQYLRNALDSVTQQLIGLQNAAARMIEEYHKEKESSARDCTYINTEPAIRVRDDDERIQGKHQYQK
mmetsp:Transcript_6948/g.42454  ORF Transcript_6948/g.42454 Transcript_6948/m.42454 type:complete len:212 (-) Transcript_6948:1091-1726(-)